MKIATSLRPPKNYPGGGDIVTLLSITHHLILSKIKNGRKAGICI